MSDTMSDGGESEGIILFLNGSNVKYCGKVLTGDVLRAGDVSGICAS